MLTENDVKEELSYAHIHAICSHAGFSCDRPVKDRDGVDVVVSAAGKLAHDAVLNSPRLELQLKSTSGIRPSEPVFSFPLPVGNYEKLRVRTALPRLLIVYLMPENPALWANPTEDSLVTQHCAYWCNLFNKPATTNTQTISVSVRRKNVVTADVMRALLTKVAREEDIGDEL